MAGSLPGRFLLFRRIIEGIVHVLISLWPRGPGRIVSAGAPGHGHERLGQLGARWALLMLKISRTCWHAFLDAGLVALGSAYAAVKPVIARFFRRRPRRARPAPVART